MVQEVNCSNDNVLLIRVSKLFRSNMSKDELYQATRGIWKVGARRNKVDYACAVYQGVIQEIYKVERWSKAGTANYDYRDLTALSTLEGRWEFIGKPVKKGELMRKRYIGKSVTNLIKQGNQNPIMYVNC